LFGNTIFSSLQSFDNMGNTVTKPKYDKYGYRIDQIRHDEPGVFPMPVPKTARETGIKILSVAEQYYEQLNDDLIDFGKKTGLQHPEYFTDKNYKKQFRFTCSFAADTAMGLTTLRVLQATTYIGSGGFGHAFQCHEVGAKEGERGHSYCLKVFHREDDEIEVLKSRHKEGCSWNKKGKGPTEHGNVVSVQGWSTQEYMHEDMVPLAPFGFVVMDLGHLGEITTDYLMKGGSPPSSILLRIMRDLLKGVAFMHSKGITNRDIKPENLVVDCFGNVRITDFGLINASIAPEERASQGIVTVLQPVMRAKNKDGTLGETARTYLAPEYVDWNSIEHGIESQNQKKGLKNPNEYSDIWSCGAACLLMHACDFPPENCHKDWEAKLLENGVTIDSKMRSFYEQVFRLKYRSERENVGQDDLNNESGQYRPSAVELLNSGMFDDGIATDAEFAAWIIQTNSDIVKECFKSCPNDVRLLSISPFGGINVFFAVLVGESYKLADYHTSKSKVNNLKKIVQLLGFKNVPSSFYISIESQDLLHMPINEQIFLATACKHAGYKYEWIDQILSKKEYQGEMKEN
jgi:serine/threonine protein kinase